MDPIEEHRGIAMPSAILTRLAAAGAMEKRLRVLVTGGAGFIGHHLVRGLLERGDFVTVLDDFSSGSRSRLEPFVDHIRLIEGSILDPATMDDAADGSEVILHHAAIASVAKSWVEPRLTNEVNVSGTIEVMVAAARHRVRRVVFAGSSSVYGVSAERICRESQRPNPQSPYGASKLASEHYVHALGSFHGIDTVVLRYFNVFGPGQDPASEYAAVIPRFVTDVMSGRTPIINGSGDISRDFIYVDNVVTANLLASARSSPTGLTCNVASGLQWTLLDLLDLVGKATGRPVDPAFGPARPGDIKHSQADISMARDALGFEIAVPFLDGLARTVAWYREQGAGQASATSGQISASEAAP